MPEQKQKNLNHLNIMKHTAVLLLNLRDAEILRNIKKHSFGVFLHLLTKCWMLGVCVHSKTTDSQVQNRVTTSKYDLSAKKQDCCLVIYHKGYKSPK